MAIKKSAFNKYFIDLIEDMINRYSITNKEAHASVLMLEEFLKLSKTFKKTLLILPKLGDLAWHEFICNTKNYSSFCNNYFGCFLPHIATSKKSSKEISFAHAAMIQAIKNNLPHWVSEVSLDAGWSNRSYPLRSEFKISNRRNVSNASDQFFDSSIMPETLDFDWLTHRLSLRYQIPLNDSIKFVKAYKQFYKSTNGSSAFIRCSTEIDAVWREHILWTSVYHRDCMSQFGSYLHRDNEIDLKLHLGAA